MTSTPEASATPLSHNERLIQKRKAQRGVRRCSTCTDKPRPREGTLAWCRAQFPLINPRWTREKRLTACPRKSRARRLKSGS